MKRTVIVQQYVKVSIDETKFDEKWMSEFRSYMYPFNSIEDHIEHLAKLHARGLADNLSCIEGYGKAADMGIKFEDGDQYEEIVDE